MNEVAGPIGQMLPSISPGYGFTAIIVAFLGRLHPLGIVIAALLIALSYIGARKEESLPSFNSTTWLAPVVDSSSMPSAP